MLFKPVADGYVGAMSAPVLDTKVSLDAEDFRANAAHNRALVQRLAPQSQTSHCD